MYKLTDPKASHKEIPQRNVLNSSFDRETRVVKVTYLYKAKKKQPFQLVVVEGRVEEGGSHGEWVDELMNAAYAGKSNNELL